MTSRFEKYLAVLKKIDFYKIFTYFLICSFIGWIYESSFDLYYVGELTNRGILFINRDVSFDFLFLKNIPLFWGLPLVEIYGIGGVVAVLFVSRISQKSFNVFLIGLFLMTFLELIASYFCEFVLHQTFWDYSRKFLNFQGRISLETSIIWGVLTVFSIKLLKPRLERIYEREKHVKYYKGIADVLVIYILVCVIVKYFSPLFGL